jgi:epoxyqueuosine reductase
MKAALVEQAHALGFALCRVARCGPPVHGESFESWLDAGMAGEMTPWLERGREKRMDPQAVLPGARSMIVLALNYWQGPGPATAAAADHPRQVSPDSPSPATGRVARYAWGDDYHDLIGTKLRALDDFLQTGGGRQRWYVDTGPVLERDFAAEAGAGWHGKSTMLLHPDLGTWYFLAEILTTLELPPDPPIAPRCGSCTRCLDACPTGAIRRERPYHLDARLCISYLTIEHRGAIPLELRPLLGDRIYGCDDCLDACPWNRFAQVSREAAFQARAGTDGMALRDYLALTEEDFRTLFRGSPIKRAKRRGLLRNVCVALGNTGSPEDVPALERAAKSEEEMIAEHARWAITRIRERYPGIFWPRTPLTSSVPTG